MYWERCNSAGLWTAVGATLWPC